MYRHIVVPTDGSSLAGNAVDQALRLAKSLDARVTFVTVLEPFRIFALAADQIGDTRIDYQASLNEEADRLLAEAAAKAKTFEVACETVKDTNDRPYEAIIETAEKAGADLIVMASHGRGSLGALLVGSETLKVLANSKIPVLVYRQ